MALDTLQTAVHPWRTRTFGGATIRIQAHSGETAGAFSLIEMTQPPFFPGAPPHRHEHFAESFYVLEGSLAVTVGSEARELPAGEFIHIPAGARHALRNATAQPVRMLLTATPGGHERFFYELMEWMEAEAEWPPRDRQRLAAFGHRHDTYYE